MKKILALILSTLGFAYAVQNPNLVANYRGTWESTVQYSLTPILHTDKVIAPMVQFSGNTYIMNGTGNATINVNPSVGSAIWDVVSVESLPNSLTDGDILVGNGDDEPAEVTMSGAITMTNTGVTSATASSFFTTPSAGNTNNVLTGAQTRVCSAGMGVIAGLAESSVTCTYGTVFTTGAYAVNATVVESSPHGVLSYKIMSQSVSAVTVLVRNESADATVAGSVNIIAIGH